MRLAGQNGLAVLFSRAALTAALLVAGCAQAPPGDKLCKDPGNPCDCRSATDHGAVVVRWRISDALAGQLLGRGQCCCLPENTGPGTLARRQCPSAELTCSNSAAWLIRQIQLRVTSADTGQTCVITKPCTDAELTTDYCLAPGLYDLQVVADVDVYDGCEEYVCANRPALSPPSVRRRVIGGQAVNLDGIVLGVNPPPTTINQDGGAPSGSCSMPADGGAHE